jgi:hypothetical protein
MTRIDETVPHLIRVQMGDSPDSVRDGTAVPHISLDESSDVVATQLARLARALVLASEKVSGPCTDPKIVNVDGNNCSIPVSEGNSLITEIGRLVAPRGWSAA